MGSSRCAVILSPWDPRSPDAGAWSDEVAWLGTALARLGFHVRVVDADDDFENGLSRALAFASAEGTLLLHVSGRLARKGVLRTAGGRWLALRTLGEALAATPAADITVMAELVHEDPPAEGGGDSLAAADHAATALAALGARDRGYGAALTVRSASMPAEGMAFTRLLLSVASDLPPEQASLSSVCARLRSMPESLGFAESFTHVPARRDLDLSAPGHAPEDLVALVDAATESRDWPRVLELRRERLRQEQSPQLRVRELVAIARILQAELGDPEGAIEALEAARAVDPGRVSVLQALRRGYETLGRWASAIEIVGALAAVVESNAERATLHYAQAKMALDHLDDEERAIGWLEAAVADDPSHDIARAMLAALRSSSGEVAPEQDALAAPEAETQPELPEGAAVESRSASAVHLVAASTNPPSSGEDAATSPAGEGADGVFDVTTHLCSFATELRRGRTDAAYLSALALEELGAPDIEPQILLGQHRTVTPVRARGSLDPAAWALLQAPGSDEVLDALFGGVARAAVAARVEQLVARERLVTLDPTARLDDTSTALVVRSFQWASRVLAVPSPALYALDRVPGDIAAVRAPAPSTAVGPSIVRGRSAKDLAFLAGRHLTYYHGAHQVLVYFPSREELTRLLMATVQLVAGDGGAPDEESRAISALSARIGRHMKDHERAAIAHAAHHLHQRGGRASLGKWTRSVELTAARAGLFLCGDLATALSVIRHETRAIARLSVEDKRRDLMAFCTSAEHVALRERYTVTAVAGMPLAAAAPAP